MNVELREVKVVAWIAVLAGVLALGGCAEGELEGNQTGENVDNRDLNSGDAQNQDNQQNQGGDNNSDNDDAPPEYGSSAHQICAAAGVSSDGQLESMYCFGPHDASGFEASDGRHTWQPGAFRIVAE